MADALEEKYSALKHIISGSHSRTPSSSTQVPPPAQSARESTGSLNQKEDQKGDQKEDQLQPSQSTQTTQCSDDGKARSRASSKASARMEPIVMHGWTLTSPVSFRDVCKAIRESAFVKNSYPIIVSLEVHADFEQQEVMVEIMKEEWEGLLLEQPTDQCDPTMRQPRLEEMLNKILIKVKKHPGKALVPGTTSSAPSLLVTPASTFDDENLSEDERAVMPHPKRGKVPICPALSALAIYTHSEHFKSFDAPSARTPGHIFSINETKILELHNVKQRELFAHNRNFFMRAFPKGMRVDSSNPDPSLYWRRGVQMVAMNWQSGDEGMMLEHAMFANEKGWVLKPPGYRSDEGEAVTLHTLDLKITIYGGQHIPLPDGRQRNDTGVVGTGGDKDFHPFVKLELHVDKAEEHMYKQKTPSCETDHPDFGKDGVSIEFKDVPNVVEELSFIR